MNKEEIRFAWAYRKLGLVLLRGLGIVRLVEWLSRLLK